MTGLRQAPALIDYPDEGNSLRPLRSLRFKAFHAKQPKQFRVEGESERSAADRPRKAIGNKIGNLMRGSPGSR
jgi:hypothetical protein